MYLYWYKKKSGINNFGDELNPYIVGHLSGEKIRYLPIATTRIKRILIAIKRMIKNQISLNDMVSLILSLKVKKYYVAIGSVIENIEGKNCYVWGAGLINRDGIIKNANYLAVRGERTRSRIIELGFDPPLAIGDPALLLPIICKPSPIKKYDLGIIPHYVQIEELSKLDLPGKHNITIINLLDSPEEVINQITACKKTISSSLHGIIVSHAYGIPSLWCNLGKKTLSGDDIKFDDYFSSVNIVAYNKFQLDFEKELLNQIEHLFIDNENYSHINKSLSDIQRNLILSSPFHILNIYKEKVLN